MILFILNNNKRKKEPLNIITIILNKSVITNADVNSIIRLTKINPLK